MKLNVRNINIASIILFMLTHLPMYLYCQKHFDFSRNNYKNLLKIDGKPHVFSDLGAWHAYSFPRTKGKFDGFSGPYLIDKNNILISENISIPILTCDNDTLLPHADSALLEYYPGMIKYSYKSGAFEVTESLIFIDNRSSLIKVEVNNLSEVKKNIGISICGVLNENSFKKLEAKDNQIEILIDDSGRKFISEILTNDKYNNEIEKGIAYKISTKEKKLLPAYESFCFYIGQSYYISKADEKKYIEKTITEPDLYFKKNEERWNEYLKNTFKNVKINLQDKYKNVAIKAVMTLLLNWRSPAGDLYHEGILPSVNGYDGFWAWDSWKHASACAYFYPELGKNNILAMYDYQDDDGMIADCIFTEKEKNNNRDTKPPLSIWAVWNIFSVTKDTVFLKNIYPKLLKYHYWWFEYRDNDNNGLCEYGSTDGTKEAAAWESGMDNAVRFDSSKMLKNGQNCWSLDQESVDLNAFLYLEKILLSNIMKALGKLKVSEIILAESIELKDKINKFMFDEKSGYYYDIRIKDKSFIKVKGPEGWLPLWAGVADKEKAEKVKNIILDKNYFNTFLPFPTLEAGHSSFNPLKGYWRGPVWIDQAAFAIEGLRKYGFKAAADTLFEKLMNNLEGILDDGSFRENYNPLDGSGLNAYNFSWSAAHILMLLLNNN